ncbi:MAG: hypothetical protein FWF67_03800 [Fibromonadales bacterium]|nr:hypothetical protein [Fibromonadales bacterium]
MLYSSKPYFSSSAAVDKLNFKDVFRHSVLHGLLNIEESERWLEYRDNMVFLPTFANDAKNLSKILKDLK